MMMEKKLKVLVVASEAGPFIKSGGLGDVVASLPKALQQAGVDVRVVIPRYQKLKESQLTDVECLGEIEVILGNVAQKANILIKPGKVPVYFIENGHYFGRDGLYGYEDDSERFGFFSKAVLEMIGEIDFYPDMIHCNDWQTGPVCMYLKEQYNKIMDYSKIKIMFTIHNLQYQGNFSKSVLNMLGVSEDCYHNGMVEFHSNVSYMKMGLMYADAISTVSETYAKEIQEEKHGYGMQGILQSRRDVLYGILNGIDTDGNNPETDTRIPNHYNATNLEGKRKNKHILQEKLGLDQRSDVPIIGMTTRLADQKGLDLLAEGFHEMMGRDIQFILIGTGEPRFESFFQEMAHIYKGRVSTNIFFDEGTAQEIYSGSDLFLMPSRFEPCGLGQMFSLRYGTIPIVRKTGGLADTVFHYNPKTKTGNGFVFESYDIGGMLWALDQSLSVFHEGQEVWHVVVENAMKSDYSMEKMAQKYIKVYKNIAEN